MSSGRRNGRRKRPVPDELFSAIAGASETLWERLARLPADAGTAVKDPAERLSAWARVYSGGDLGALVRRLSWDGIDPRRAAAALEEPGVLDTLPDWIEELVRYREVAARGEKREAREAGGKGRSEVPFEPMWRPWVEVAIEGFAAEPREQWRALSTSAREGFERLLLVEIAELSERALYEIFDSIRQGAGEGVTGIYDSFISSCLEQPVEVIYRNFPVLARQTCERVRQWRSFVGELMARLDIDRADIAESLCDGRDPGAITAVESRQSDRHNDGNVVLLLELSSGTRLVYKPRSVAPEAFFRNAIEWLRHEGLDPAPPSAAVLARDGYGWMEYVERAVLGSREEAVEYYRRAGSLLALSYALRGRDLHAENVVATANGPVLIDCELLLQPLRQRFSSGERLGELVTAAGSCIATGLLTHPLPTGDEDREMGGLRGWREREVPGSSWRDVNSDRMAPVEERSLSGPGANTVWLGDELLDPKDFAAELLEGFRSTYRFLMERRDGFGDAGGPLSECAEIDVRLLLRGSEEYGRVLSLLRRPRNQRSGMVGSWMHEAMLSIFSDWEDRPALWPLVARERESLAVGDIPTFWVNVSGSTLSASDGGDVSGLLAMSGLEAVRAQLDGMSESDLAEQSEQIEAALSEYRPEGPTADALERSASAPGKALGEACTRVARALGREITAAVESGACDGSGWTLAEGRPGVALFLDALSRSGLAGRQREDLESAVERLVSAARQQAARGWPGTDELPIGGIHGVGSTVWSLAVLGDRRGDETLIEAAMVLAGKIDAARIAADDTFDLTFGAAGATLGLLRLAEANGERDPLESARRCGEHLLAAQRVVSSSGAGWRNPGGIVQTGFAHGCAGIARALSALAEATGDSRFLVAALAALGFERGLFNRSKGNWPVLLRDSDGRRRRQWMVAYCRGAPGVALSRMLLVESLRDATTVAEQELALDTCASAPLSPLDMLCCGSLGRSWVLTTAAERFGSDDRRTAGETLASRSLENAARSGLLTTSLDAFENRQLEPGFLKGHSGIGYQLLRLAGVAALPDVLSLELERERERRWDCRELRTTSNS